MAAISASVGKGGQNVRRDVTLVQQLLKQLPPIQFDRQVIRMQIYPLDQLLKQGSLFYRRSRRQGLG